MKLRTFAAIVALLGAQAAWADLITYTVDTGNPALSAFSGPFADVDVDRTDSTHATVTFTSLTQTIGSTTYIYLLGDGGSVAVNVNATSFTFGSITGSNAGTGFSPGPWSDGGAGHEDGWGIFNLTINSFDGYTSSSDTISFIVTNTSGTWASASDVLALNSNNALVAAHIFVTTSPANADNGALVTGFAAGNCTGTDCGGGPPNNVPEPETLALLGLGLFGLALIRRRGANA